MAGYKLAPLADADLVNIANKTINDWGYKQAIDTTLNKHPQLANQSQKYTKTLVVFQSKSILFIINNLMMVLRLRAYFTKEWTQVSIFNLLR